MNRTSLLLSSIALASLSMGLVADEAKAPLLQSADPVIEPARLLAAQAVIERDVMAYFKTPGGESPARNFSRVLVPPRSSVYTLAMVDTAPNGVTKTAEQLPFEVRHQPNPKAATTVHLAGYYDANAKCVQVFSAASKTYVLAAEHPFIKARMPEKKP